MDLREKLQLSQFCWDNLSHDRGELLKKGEFVFMGGVSSDRLQHSTIEFEGARRGREDGGGLISGFLPVVSQDTVPYSGMGVQEVPVFFEGLFDGFRRIQTVGKAAV